MSLADRYIFEELGASEQIWKQFVDESLESHEQTHNHEGSWENTAKKHVHGLALARIVRVDRGLPLASSAQGTTRVELAPPLARKASKNPLKRVAVGDWVVLSFPEGHETPLVEKILPRSSEFLRKDPAEQALAQVVIANVDIVFVVVAFSKHGVNIARLERYLVLAFESNAKPVIILTKADLISDEEEAKQLAQICSVVGEVPVIAESAVTLEGIDQIAAMLTPGVTAAMVGASGVGKSTLANKLLGEDVLDAAEVRDRDDKGRHTTVAREIVVLPGGGILIDTPGIRTIALWSGDTGLPKAFPEITELAGDCRFADCRHEAEPNCAVQDAVAGGTLDRERFSRYLKLREELEDVEKSRTSHKRRSKR